MQVPSLEQACEQYKKHLQEVIVGELRLCFKKGGLNGLPLDISNANKLADILLKPSVTATDIEIINRIIPQTPTAMFAQSCKGFYLALSKYRAADVLLKSSQDPESLVRAFKSYDYLLVGSQDRTTAAFVKKIKPAVVDAYSRLRLFAQDVKTPEVENPPRRKVKNS